MSEQLELFENHFDWKYVFEQIRGRPWRAGDFLGINEVNDWGISQRLDKFTLDYMNVVTTRTMQASGYYSRKVRERYE